MIATTEKRPLFLDLGEIARAMTSAIRHLEGQGLEAKAIHINPKMLEVMDQMAGFRIERIGKYPITPDANVPMDRYRVRKW